MRSSHQSLPSTMAALQIQGVNGRLPYSGCRNPVPYGTADRELGWLLVEQGIRGGRAGHADCLRQSRLPTHVRVERSRIRPSTLYSWPRADVGTRQVRT